MVPAEGVGTMLKEDDEELLLAVILRTLLIWSLCLVASLEEPRDDPM